MALEDPKCPQCNSHYSDLVSIDEHKMTFVCCRSCRAVLAYRDDFLIEKLDKIIEELKPKE